MDIMINKFSKLLFVLFLLAGGMSFGSVLQLNAEEGHYVIHLSTNALSTEKYAAEELQQYFEKMSSVKLPIVTTVPLGKHAVYVGHSAEAGKKLSGIKLNQLNRDQVIVKEVDRDIVVVGEGARGTIYAADILLEEGFGVKWWNSKNETVPKNSLLEVSNININYTPPFFFRGVYYNDVVCNPAFSVRMKSNGQFCKIPENMGGHLSAIGFVHTFWRLIPTEKYFEKHPEWFSLVEGKRIPGGSGKGQLCLTNKKMRAELIKNAKKWLEQHPETRIISVSQNDVNGDYCECENCKKVVAEEGQSGLLIDFVNEVAEALEKDYPDVIVETLAYYDTLKAPISIKPRHNVMVRFAPITADFGKPLSGEGLLSHNKDFAVNLQRWHDLGATVGIWNYTANYANYFIPHPNFENLGNDLRFFRTNGAKAIFEEGGPTGSLLCNFSSLRTWIISKLLWNPDLKVNDLRDEFLKGYYGPAAPQVLSVYLIMMNSFEKTGGILRCSMNGCGWFPIEKIQQAQTIMSNAMVEYSDNAELVRRLRLVKATFDFAYLNSLSVCDLDDAKKEEAQKLLRELQALVQTYNAHYYAEGGKTTAYFEKLEKRINNEGLKDQKSGNVPSFCKDLSSKQWYEFSPEKFRLFKMGTQTRLDEDSNAAYGKVAWLTSKSNWLLQLQIPSGSWDVWISLRLKDGTGQNIIFGNAAFYDEVSGKNINVHPLNAANFSDKKFTWLDIGTVDVNTGYLYIAPTTMPQLKGIEVERIVIINKKEI